MGRLNVRQMPYLLSYCSGPPCAIFCSFLLPCIALFSVCATIVLTPIFYLWISTQSLLFSVLFCHFVIALTLLSAPSLEIDLMEVTFSGIGVIQSPIPGSVRDGTLDHLHARHILSHLKTIPGPASSFFTLSLFLYLGICLPSLCSSASIPLSLFILLPL